MVQKVNIADHLWKTVETMAHDMGLDTDAVVNQALFTLARLNGYSVPGKALQPSLSEAARPKGLEIKSPPRAGASGINIPTLAEEIHAAEPISELDELPPLGDVPSPPSLLSGPPEMVTAMPPSATEIDTGMGRSLFLSHKGAHPVEVTGNRFVLGRGKHCSFVIDSTRVSREHAVVVKEGNDFFMEDLKSSNGTWNQNARISKKKIQDGDEFLLGSEPVKCSLKFTGRR